MELEEMKNRLNEFAKYLDNMESSLEKGKLSSFFVGYIETLKALQFEIAKNKHHFEEKGD